MKNQINISNLTPEQIEDLRQQLKALDEQPKTIMDRVKSWEDAKNIIKPEFWIESFGVIAHDVQSPITKNNIPSEKHAKSILATCQLMVIAEALNGGWNPDYRSSEAKYHVEFDNEIGLEIDYWGTICATPIVFKSAELAKYTISQFPDLWYDYFMIDKPTKQ